MDDDQDKTKDQLIAELAALRAEVATLKQQQNDCELSLQHLSATGRDSHLAAIVTSSGDAIISKSLEGKILSWNTAAERIFGYTAEEAIGQPISILTSPDHINDISEILQKVRHGESIYHYETVRRRKDGQLIDVSITVSPIRDALGNIIAVSVIKQDITERKRAEAEMRQTEVSLSAFMQAVPDLITRVKQDGTRIAIFSGAANTLKPFPINANVRDIMSPDLAQQRLHYIQQAIATQELQVYEYSLDLNGNLQYEEARIVAAGDEEAFVMIRNITDRKRAEKQLELQDLIVKTMAEGACLVRAADGIIVYANPKFERMFGYDSGELNGQPMSIINYEHVFDSAERGIQEIFHHIETKGEYSYEVHNVKKDGTPFWCRVTMTRFEHPEHGIVYVAVQEDISDRKQIEEALRNSEERYRAIVEDQTELICRFLPDSTILFVNDAYCRYFGLNREEVIGKSYQPVVYEADQEQVAQRVNSMSQDNPTVLIENRVVVNGQVRWTQWINRLIVGKDDHTIEYQSVGRDITDRKQIEATLHESDRRWRSLLDNVQLLVVGLDQQGNVEYVNPFFLALTDYTPAEVIGKSWFNHFLPSYLKPEVGTVFREMMQQENFHAHYQNPILTKSGEERIIAWSNTLLHDINGEPIGTVSIGEDITDRYRLERMKAEFISIVSHELRTPLTSMQAALSLLYENIVDPASEDGQTIIQIAANGADRLVRLVNDILDLERLESGKIRLEKQLCNTIDLITTAIDQMQEMANQAGVTLDAAPISLEIYADCDRLLQVLTNLLSNAIKFSSKGDRIWLKVEVITDNASAHQKASLPEMPSPNSILFTVRDQGRGIPADKLESIFERFHQVDASDSREKSGTGLGLAICRSIVEQHGGRIWAESVLGEGSTFCFIMPLEVC